MKTVFLRALKADDKVAILRAAIGEPETAIGKQRFEVEAHSFKAVPHSPFAYWTGTRVRQLFSDFPALETNGRAARQGGINGDDFRWLRLWTETTPLGNRGRFIPIAKGGQFSPFYADLWLQCWWDPARDSFWSFTGLPHRPSLTPASFDFYFRPGLTWPRRTQGGLSLRAMPAGCVFADKGPTAFVEHDDTNHLLALLGIANAKVFRTLVDLQMAFGSYEVGVIQRTPIPDLTSRDASAIASLARRAWSLKRRLDARNEISHAFVLPAVMQVGGKTVIARTAAWTQYVLALEAELGSTQAEIDAHCFELYCIDEADRRSIVDSFGDGADHPNWSLETDGDSDGDSEEVDDEGDPSNNMDATTLAADLVSWAIGVAFGRFDIRLATGGRPLPAEPEPFDPLPPCSPAMLTGQDGFPLTSPPGGYPIHFPESGILVDDPGHARDLTTAIRFVFEEAFKESGDAWWNEAVALLDPHDHDLRTWLKSSFFEYHLKHYWKSRRKAPILWQLSVPSGQYSIWLYALRLNRDTFFQIQNDFLTPKLTHEERQLVSLVQGANPGTQERREIAARQAYVEELRALLDEVKRIAPLWKPDLDDGVVLTMAPLWRLVPQHKPWQKELKSKWDELVAGEYDWAHIAMHLWPERVVPKCATDRSLAISHGLEDVFWVEDANGKWKPRSKPTATVDDLIHERSSPAVKSALKALLQSPNGASSRTRRNKAAGVVS